MLFMKLHSVTGEEIADAKEDYKGSKRIGQYRISSVAIYFPDGQYIPVREITEVVRDKTSVHVSGCCAGGVPVDRLVITVGQKKHQLIFDSSKEIETALTIINMNARG